MKRGISFVRGGYYHIFNRGANRNKLFVERDNYEYVLRLLHKYSEKYDIAIVAYALLPNHYHLLIRQNGDASARFLPQHTFNTYTKAFNKRYDHVGTLFQGPFRAIEVHTTAYLLNLVRYIHANPVLHGLIDDPGQWEFSNYLEWTGQRAGTLGDRAFVRAHFDTPAAYERFVLDYLRQRQLPLPLADYLQTLDT